MLTCRDVSDTASDYLEGPTTFLQRLSFRTHLFICRDCRQYFKQLQLAIGVTRDLEQPATPLDDDVERILEAIHKADNQDPQ